MTKSKTRQTKLGKFGTKYNKKTSGWKSLNNVEEPFQPSTRTKKTWTKKFKIKK